MQMANLIDRFCLLQQLAFLAFIFANILVCGGDGPIADEDKAQQLVTFIRIDEHGIPQQHNRDGSFGKWMKWTECDYNVNNQCMDGPGEGQKVIRSYRILAHCANGDDCEEAKLLFCYPSRLDPLAFPDENGKDPDITPGRRAMSQISVVNDPDHNITKACALLLEECRKNDACLDTLPKMAKKDGEQWHGFLMTRVKQGFNIHMPFGKKGKRFNIPDDELNAAETPHFYLNFGDKNKAMKTFVTRKSHGNLGSDKLTSDASLQKYSDGSSQGIHLKEAPGLWMLGLDILPDEEHQQLRLYTMGFPTVYKWTYCERTQANDGLVNGTQREVAYIDAWFLKPYTPDKAVPARPIPQKVDTIKLENKICTQQINTNQGFTSFFVHAHVTSDTKSMDVKIVIGSKEQFKLILFHFEYNIDDGTCTVFFQNDEKNCNKFEFNAEHDSFLLFVDMDNGVVALNCQQELKFKGPLILPNVDKAEFQITGEGMELFGLTSDRRQPVLESMPKNYPNRPIFMDLTLQMDMLDIVPGNDIFYLMMTAKTYSASKFIQMELITKENVSMATMIFKQNCSKDNPIPGQKPRNGFIPAEMKEKHCAPLNCIDDSCAGVFYLFVIFNNNGEIIYNFNGVDVVINEQKTNNTQIDGPNVPNEPKSLIPFFAQVFGDLYLPVATDAFKKVKERSLKFDRPASAGSVRRLTIYQNVIIHGIIFNPEGKFKIQYHCLNCFKKTGKQLSKFLTLEFDNHAKSVSATVPDAKGEPVNFKSSVPLDLEVAKPFTIKITIEETSENVFDYQTLLNNKQISLVDANYIDDGSYVFAEYINVWGDIALLDKISALPYVLKIDAVNGYKINAKFRLMDSGQIVQMILAGIPGDSDLAMYLGIDNVEMTKSALKLEANKGIVYAHIWAQYDEAAGMYKFCLDEEFKIIEKGKKAECKAAAKLDYDYKKMGKIVNAKIAVFKDGTIHVDFNGHRVGELKQKDATNNATFVIGGDITLVDWPKQV